MSEDRERAPLSLFEGFGIELEYMIVDRESLDVLPIADRLLADAGGAAEGEAPEMEIERGAAAWSNELALHVIELKTHGPSPTLEGLGALFLGELREADRLLEARGARILPSAMHPWMDPERELRLWPHEADLIYRTFDRIFDCRGHGWANLQSTHINLPFRGDEEFGRLHAAIRLILPILPALAASSPYVEGRRGPALDSRLSHYRSNAARVPSVSGQVIPERVFTRAAYEEELLGGIYRDLAPHDPEGVLRHEWVNARGAIARFDRMAIEIRVLDTQEQPAADLAIAAAVVAALRAIVEERFLPYEAQRAFREADLSALFDRSVAQAEEAIIEDEGYLRALGFDGAKARAGELWARLIERTLAGTAGEAEHAPALARILEEGSLARRLLRAAGEAPTRGALREVYAELGACALEGRSFSCPR